MQCKEFSMLKYAMLTWCHTIVVVPSNITYTEVVNEQQQDTTITTFDPTEMPCHSLKLNVDAKPFIPAITIKKEEADADDCMKITSKNLMYEN